MPETGFAATTVTFGRRARMNQRQCVATLTSTRPSVATEPSTCRFVHSVATGSANQVEISRPVPTIAAKLIARAASSSQISLPRPNGPVASLRATGPDPGSMGPAVVRGQCPERRAQDLMPVETGQFGKNATMNPSSRALPMISLRCRDVSVMIVSLSNQR